MPPRRLPPEDDAIPLDALRKAGLLTCDPAPQYDTLAKLAAGCCATSYAALMLLDEGQMWIKAQSGMCLDDPLALQGVAQHIAAEEAPLVCPNARDEPLHLPSLGCPLQSAFWAGCPVLLPNSALCIGVLLVVDPLPKRRIPRNLMELLELLSRQAGHLLSGDVHALEEWRQMNLFVAKVSHELRTPLNGILGCTALLQDQLAGADLDVMETLRHISNSAEHNLKTVNQILDFAKLDAGRVELEQLPFDLRECVEEVMAMLPLDRKARDVELGYEMAQDAEVVGDPHRLKQVLLNLLSNALKVTLSGSVLLSVSIAPDDALPSGHSRVNFVIQDTGPGIPEDHAARLFQPFTQVRASDSRGHSGTGLGLTISRMLVEAMGGRLGFSSTVGEGSSFHFSVAAPTQIADCPAVSFAGKRALLVGLPDCRTSLLLQHLASLQVEAVDIPSWDASEAQVLATFDLAIAAAPPSPGSPLVPWALTGGVPMSPTRPGRRPPALVLPAVISQRWLGKRLEELWSPLSNLSMSSSSVCSFSPTLGPAWDPSPDLVGLRVLVVDDVRTNQMVLTGFLKRLECEVEVRSNGAEAVAAVSNKMFDVVVMDLHMPVMDGFQAARQLNASCSAFAPRPYLLASSALIDAGVRTKCLQAGFDGILEKPLRFRQLRQALLMARRSAGGDLDSGFVECSSPVHDDSPQITLCRSPLLKALDTSLFAFTELIPELGAAVSHNSGPATPHGNRFKLLSSLRTTNSFPARTVPPPQTPLLKVPMPPKAPTARRMSRMSTIVFPQASIGPSG